MDAGGGKQGSGVWMRAASGRPQYAVVSNLSSRNYNKKQVVESLSC